MNAVAEPLGGGEGGVGDRPATAAAPAAAPSAVCVAAQERPAPPRWLLLSAFAAVYLIWGSTYLAIRFAIETMPPFLMAAVRFLIAGGALYGWARWRSQARPARVEWRSALIVGGLLLFAGNGVVVWSELRIDSGLAALLVATVPLWIVALDALRPGGVRPGWRVWAGVAGGLAGIALLVGPAELAGAERADLLGILGVLFASLAWAVGSLYSRHAPLPASPALGTGMEMLAGGLLLALFSLALGEPAGFDPAAVSATSALALAYLVFVGALIGFSAYVWLLRVAPAAKVATYAYVNPVVALLLGWALAGEELDARTLIAAAVILGSVFLIVSYRPR